MRRCASSSATSDEADIVIGYTRRMWRERTWQRTLISKTFTLLVNVITRQRLTYYNGLQIHRASILKSLQIESRGYGFQAEVLVKALRCTRTYREVAMDLNERTRGESQAFRLKNIVDVAANARVALHAAAIGAARAARRREGRRPMIGGSAAPFRAAHKIVSLDGLSALRTQFADRSIVLCHGAFDLVHMGHLIHFEDARALGDILVVTITADRHITKKRSVSFSEEYRARQLAALEIVDYVAIIDEPSAVTPIERLRPDVYVKGPEYANLVLDKTANIFREKALVEQLGGRIHFTNGATFSSTKLAHFLLAAPEAAQTDPLLSNDRVLFRDLSALGFTLDQLKGFLAGASRLRVCVIGETIIDEWVDVTAHQPLAEVALRRRSGNGAEPADRRRRRGGLAPRHLRRARSTATPMPRPRRCRPT